jgi:hypothetical protein
VLVASDPACVKRNLDGQDVRVVKESDLNTAIYLMGLPASVQIRLLAFIFFLFTPSARSTAPLRSPLSSPSPYDHLVVLGPPDTTYPLPCPYRSLETIYLFLCSHTSSDVRSVNSIESLNGRSGLYRRSRSNFTLSLVALSLHQLSPHALFTRLRTACSHTLDPLKQFCDQVHLIVSFPLA